MKLNSLFYFILISYINSSTIITISDDIHFSPTEYECHPLSALIEPNNYFLYCYEVIYIIDYITNETKTSNGIPSDIDSFRSFEIGKDTSMIILYTIYMEEMIKDDNSASGYNFEMQQNDNKFDVFSIGNIEDEWRFVIIDDTTKQIHFQNFQNAKSNNNIYIASFDPNYASFDNIKCKYYNTKVYCICINSTNRKFKFYIIPIDKITNSNQLTISDIDYYSESEIEGKFINIFTFPNSEPLISYELSSQKFLSNFKGEKLEIVNSNIYFSDRNFLIGEINGNQYYSCAIKSDDKKIIICNIIPYSQNGFTESSINL